MAEAERMLEGRRAIVTGASRGIGAEIARAMARAEVPVIDTSPTKGIPPALQSPA